MSKQEILASIKASEGRVLISEVIGTVQPLLYNISNAELAAAFGADLLLLNMFDPEHPVFHGLPETAPTEIIREIKRLTGRLIGVNLEPVDEATSNLPLGRRASVSIARQVREMGADLIVLTGNPGTAVSKAGILNAISSISQELGADLIIAAGKMHAAGVWRESGEGIITPEDVLAFAAAGCDLILMPAPGTVPGLTLEYVRSLVKLARRESWSSPPSALPGGRMRDYPPVALQCKMVGADLHHLGTPGIGDRCSENIMTYSIAIRGRRHAVPAWRVP